MQHHSTSSTPALGFTRSLVSYLESSREKLQIFVDEKMAKADSTRASLDHLAATEQADIRDKMDRLERIQQQRGILTDECSESTHTAAHLLLLKDKQVHLEHDLAQAHASLTQTQMHLDESQRLLCLERNKAAQVKKMKLRALEAKKTTVEDLTYAIIKYRMLGLDFVKGDTGPTSLQCNFTQVDPADPLRIFSFCLNLSQDDDYQVDKCTPPLPAHVIMNLVEELNSSSSPTDAISEFIRGMRRAFKCNMHVQ